MWRTSQSRGLSWRRKLGTKAIARRSLFSNVECHISGAACRGYFITMWQRMLTRSGGPIIGRLVVHILSPAHLPLASDISVGSRTSRSSTRDKECSISHQSDILLLTDLLFRQLPVLSPKHSSSEGLVGSTLLTIDKPEIAALSHIALLQGPLQGEGKGSENVDSPSTPPLSPTRAPRPASRESCGDGGGEHNGAKSAAPECIACTMHSIACTTLKCLQPPPSPPILWPKATGKGSPPP